MEADNTNLRLMDLKSAQDAIAKKINKKVALDVTTSTRGQDQLVAGNGHDRES
jgi:hypothetical protein